MRAPLQRLSFGCANLPLRSGIILVLLIIGAITVEKNVLTGAEALRALQSTTNDLQHATYWYTAVERSISDLALPVLQCLACSFGDHHDSVQY